MLTYKYTMILLFVIGTIGSYVLAAPENLYNEYAATCAQLMTPRIVNRRCNHYFDIIATLMEPCKNNSSESWSCQNSICMLKNQNLISDGEVSEKTVIEHIDAHIQNHPEATPLTTEIRDFCLNKKYEQYHPSETCSPLKYQICVNAIFYLDYLTEENWRDSSTDCIEVLEIGLYCQTVVSKLKRNTQ